MRGLYWLLLVVALLAAASLRAGDSSGGGSTRVLQFKRAVGPYLNALRSQTKSTLQKEGITVSPTELADALFGDTTVHPLLITDSGEINSDRKVIYKEGRITEAGVPLTCYYDALAKKIYVGVEWSADQNEVALKEFLRVVDSANAERETVAISNWYMNQFPRRLKIAADDFPFLYEKILKTYDRSVCENAKENFISTIRDLQNNTFTIRIFGDGYSQEDYQRDQKDLAQFLRKKMPLFEPTKLPPVWDWKWVADETERNTLVAKHQEIADELNAARSSLNKAERLKTIQKWAQLLQHPRLESIATHAMGDLGDSQATPFLIEELARDTKAADADPKFLEKSYHSNTWAPIALASLDYSQDATAQMEAEAALFALYEANLRAPFSVGSSALDGIVLLGSQRGRDLLRSRLLNQQDVWNSARGVATIREKDENYHHLPLAFEAALIVEGEREFSALLNLLVMHREDFLRRGVNQGLVFATMLEKAKALQFINGDTRLLLVALIPDECR